MLTANNTAVFGRSITGMPVCLAFANKANGKHASLQRVTGNVNVLTVRVGCPPYDTNTNRRWSAIVCLHKLRRSSDRVGRTKFYRLQYR